MIDIKAIKAAAEKATPGEWLAADNGHIYSAALNLLAVAQHCRDKDANAKHIATANPATVIALCDEIERLKDCLKKANDQAEHFEREWYLRGDEVERLQQQLTIYEKHGVTCQTFGHKLTGCAECNRDDNADDAMALDTLKLQARQYFELLPEIERLRTKLEVTDKTGYDGIDCRDETIRLQDEEIDRLTIIASELQDLCDRQAKRLAEVGKDAARYKKLVEMEADLVEPITIWHYLRNPDDLDAAMEAQK